MVKTYFDNIINRIDEKHPNEPELKSAAREVISSLSPVFEEDNLLIYNGILENIIEQDRIIDLINPMLNHPLTSHTSEESSHGIVYFMKEMLADKNMNIGDKTAIVSGSDSFALHVMTKLSTLGVKIIACSDEEGVIHDSYGIDLKLITSIKSSPKDSLSQYIMTYPDAIYIKNPSAIWQIPCEIAMACTLDTPLNIEGAKKLVKGGCIALGEGTNVSTSNETVSYLLDQKILFMPLKALAMSSEISESHTNRDYQLEKIIKEAFKTCKNTAVKYGYRDHLSFGANISGFQRVRQGLV